MIHQCRSMFQPAQVDKQLVAVTRRIETLRKSNAFKTSGRHAYCGDVMHAAKTAARGGNVSAAFRQEVTREHAGAFMGLPPNQQRAYDLQAETKAMETHSHTQYDIRRLQDTAHIMRARCV